MFLKCSHLPLCTWPHQPFHSYRQADDPRRAPLSPGQWDNGNGEQEEEGSCDGPPHPQSGPVPPHPPALLPLCCVGSWSEGLGPGGADAIGERRECRMESYGGAIESRIVGNMYLEMCQLKERWIIKWAKPEPAPSTWGCFRLTMLQLAWEDLQAQCVRFSDLFRM